MNIEKVTNALTFLKYFAKNILYLSKNVTKITRSQIPENSIL